MARRNADSNRVEIFLVEAMVNAKGLKKEIASTLRLVGKSVKTMSRLAREIGKKQDT